MRTASLILSLILGSAVLAQEAPVPLFSPEEAWELAHKPQARMVDEAICERIEGVFVYGKDGGRQVIAGRRTALFRKGATKPFMVVETRQDGVYVARFPAKPFEVTISRSMYVDEERKRVYYGQRAWKATCVAGKATVGDLVPVEAN